MYNRYRYLLFFSNQFRHNCYIASIIYALGGGCIEKKMGQAASWQIYFGLKLLKQTLQVQIYIPEEREACRHQVEREHQRG